MPLLLASVKFSCLAIMARASICTRTRLMRASYYISRSDAPIVPRCCRLGSGNVNGFPTQIGYLGLISGDHREVVGQF